MVSVNACTIFTICAFLSLKKPISRLKQRQIKRVSFRWALTVRPLISESRRACNALFCLWYHYKSGEQFKFTTGEQQPYRYSLQHHEVAKSVFAIRTFPILSPQFLPLFHMYIFLSIWD